MRRTLVAVSSIALLAVAGCSSDEGSADGAASGSGDSGSSSEERGSTDCTNLVRWAGTASTYASNIAAAGMPARPDMIADLQNGVDTMRPQSTPEHIKADDLRELYVGYTDRLEEMIDVWQGTDRAKATELKDQLADEAQQGIDACADDEDLAYEIDDASRDIETLRTTEVK